MPHPLAAFVSRPVPARRTGRAGSGRVPADAGFGLVELIVSMGVVAVISVVLVLALGESFRASALSRERSVAVGLLSAADSQVQALPAGSLGAVQGTSTTVNGISYCTSYSPTTSQVGAVTLYTFAISVTWPGCSGASSVTGTVQAGGT